jgi:hypothetical protein
VPTASVFFESRLVFENIIIVAYIYWLFCFHFLVGMCGNLFLSVCVETCS